MTVALKTRSRSNKRDQILKGALRVFLEEGYANASMDRIASESAVSKQTIYAHFKDKETLFTALVESMICQSVDNAETRSSSLEPSVVLTKLAMNFLSRCDDWQFVALIRLLTGESNRFPELAEIYVKKALNPTIQTVAQYFDERLNWPDAEAAARVFIGSLYSYIHVQEIFSAKHMTAMSRERFAKSLVDILLKSGVKEPIRSGTIEDFSPPSMAAE